MILIMRNSQTDRLANVRFIGPVLGRYALESRRFRTRDLPAFMCRLQSISLKMLVAAAPVSGSIGETVNAHFQPFGTVHGHISRHFDGGFCADLDLDQDRCENLASRIDWYKKRVFAGVPDRRMHKRFMPRDPRSTLLLPNGACVPCLLIDVSGAGAAVSASINPKIGAPLAVGQLVGRVVRHLETGFAVRFVTEQRPSLVEQLLRHDAQ